MFVFVFHDHIFVWKQNQIGTYWEKCSFSVFYHFPNARARKQSFLVSKHFGVLNSCFLDSIFQEMLFSAQSIIKCNKNAILWIGFRNSVWQKFFDECRSFERLQIFLTTSWILSKCIDWYVVQVNLRQKFFFLQNMGRTCCVQKLFWMSKTISAHNMISPGLSLEFSCTLRCQLNE